MMDRLRLSVVVVSRDDRSALLRRALDSLLKQSYPNLEFFIIDANEGDSPASLSLQEDLADYPRFNYVQPQLKYRSLGLKNSLLNRISGAYVCFTNGRERWDPNKCMLQVNQLEADPEAVLSCCDGHIYYEGARNVAMSACLTDVSYSDADWLMDLPVKTPGQIVYRADALRAVGGFRSRLNVLEDIDAMIRLRETGRVRFLRMSLLDANLRMDRAYYRALYRDCVCLKNYVNYLDIFILNRDTFFRYNMRAIQAALRGNLGFEAMLYAVQTFLRAPFRSLQLLFSTAGRAAGGLLLRLRGRLACRGWLAAFKRALPTRRDFDAHIAERRTRSRGAAGLVEKGVLASAIPAYRYMGGAVSGAFEVLDHVEVIGRGAFAGCHRLERVRIPASVRVIEDGAFMDCAALREVQFCADGQLEKIGDYAFAGCGALEALKLPVGLSALGRGAFARCGALRLVDFYRLREGQRLQPGTFPEALRALPREVFAHCGQLSYVGFTVGSLLRTIDSYAFFECKSLNVVWIEASLSSIAPYAFAGCGGMERIVMVNPGALREIGDHAFMDCARLTQFALPPAIERIERQCFKGCLALESVHVPKSCKRIESGAFAGCMAMASVYIDGEATKIRYDAFERRTRIVNLRELGEAAER